MPEKPENELTEQARQSIEELKATIRQEVFSEQKRQRRTQLIYAGLGIVIGVAVSAALFQWWDTIAKIQPLLVGVLVVAIVAVGGAAVAFIWFRDSIFGKFFKAGVASYEAGIENATQTFVPLLTKLLPKLDTAELQTGIDALKKSGLQIAAYFAYIRARRMVFGWLVALAAGLAAFLGTTLLVRQNELLKQQIYLTEAARRSSYIMLMDNILNQVNEELKGTDTTPYHFSRRLSTVTIGRIAALSQSLRPYYYLRGDTLSNYLSPERGQLLLALVYARLDTTHTYPEIYESSKFEYADLTRANLNYSFLQKADLYGANMSWANLIKADFSQANLERVALNGATLTEACLKQANLNQAYLEFAHLAKANLSGADLITANLKMVHLEEANLSGADLSRANLYFSHLTKANLTGADLLQTNLQEADLVGANLNRVEFLSETDLKSARVGSLEFLDSLKYLGVMDWETILEKYRVDTFPESLFEGQYFILPKNK